MTGLESELALFIRWQVGRIPWLHTTINTLINRHSIPIGSSQNAKVIKSFWLLRIHHLVFLRKRNVDSHECAEDRLGCWPLGGRTWKSHFKGRGQQSALCSSLSRCRICEGRFVPQTNFLDRVLACDHLYRSKAVSTCLVFLLLWKTLDVAKKGKTIKAVLSAWCVSLPCDSDVLLTAAPAPPWPIGCIHAASLPHLSEESHILDS